MRLDVVKNSNNGCYVFGNIFTGSEYFDHLIARIMEMPLTEYKTYLHIHFNAKFDAFNECMFEWRVDAEKAKEWIEPFFIAAQLAERIK